MPFLPWLAANAVPLIGGLLGAGGQIHQNNSARAVAREQMAFQERMSSTAYQRSREDMIAAGLNPAMMAHSGGASSPGGASAQLGNVATAGMTSARDAALAKEQIEQIKAQTRIVRAEARLKEIEAGVADTSVNGGPNLAGLLAMRRDAEFSRLGYEMRGNQREYDARGRDIDFEGKLQPAMLREYISRAILSELSQNEARANSRFFGVGGAAIPALGLLTNSAGSVAGALSGLSRAATAARTSRHNMRPVEEVISETFGRGYRETHRFRRSW